MTKIPTVYDIGNFALDWNNITNIGDDERILWQAPKDGIIFYDTVNGAGDLNTSFMISPEFPSTISKADPYTTSVSKLATISWETPGNYSMNYIGGGGSLASHGSYAEWAPIKKGEYVCFVEQTVNSNNNTHIFRRQFIPFLYQGVQPQPGCVSYVIETGHNQDNTAFYRKYSDGYIEQWGYSSYESKSEGQISVTYATPFSSNVNFPTITPVGDNGTDMETYVYPNSVNATGFSWYANHDSYVAGKKTEQPGLFTNLKGAYWHACGY